MAARMRIDSKLVKCPYYKGHTDAVIYCEGPLENTLIHIAHGSVVGRREYMRACCNSKYQRCILYEPLERKWRNNYKIREGR